MASRPILILEGPGDKAAIPLAIRNWLYGNEIYDISIRPSPIIGQNIPTLLREGELERFLKYALSRDGDSVLIFLDTDKECPKEVVLQFIRRAKNLNPRKKIGFSFFKCEFECLFLFCLDLIAEKYPDYGWDLDKWDPSFDFESIVGAKGLLSRLMKPGRSYKETRDQAKFTSVIDFSRLRDRSRCFRHFEKLLLWLDADQEKESFIYPEVVD